MFDICAICANQNDKGKCIKPGETCDEAYDFRLKPVYRAAPEMLEVLKELSDLFSFEPLPLDAVGISFEVDDLKGTSPHIESINKAFKRASNVLSKIEGRQL